VSERLPLFPLGQPLFPDIPISLEIFEQRYLRLIKESLRESATFGIVAIADGSEVGGQPDIFLIGLAVDIIDWRQLESGLLGITVSGTTRFEVLVTSVEEDGLLIGEVERLSESGDSISLPEENLEALENLLRELVRHPSLDWLSLDDDRLSAVELGWKLAQALPVSLDKKVPLLAEPDAAKRLAIIQSYVDELSAV
jgi:uncharacterized protein